LENLDSALVIFQELAEVEDNPDVRARTLLSLHYLSGITSPDSVQSDSLLELVHQDFPDSDYDRWVRPILGLEPLPLPVDTVLDAFRTAEELWLTHEKPDSAVDEYLALIERWPESEYAPQALYAAAWLQERRLDDVDGAMASYDSLIAWYPQSEYVQIARNKLEPPPPDLPDSLEALEDSTLILAAAGELGEAPPGSGSVVLIGGENAIIDYIHQNHLYPMVAEEAELPGEVTVSFTVSADGVPGNFRIEREDPEGFDFGENAILALREMKFRPAYEDGQYIDSPAEQIVRFIP
jgi:TonB family protein